MVRFYSSTVLLWAAMAMAGLSLGACDSGDPLTTSCSNHVTDETVPSQTCVITFSGCTDGANYDVVCTKDLTIHCSCRKNSAATGSFASETLCPWIDRIETECGWENL